MVSTEYAYEPTLVEKLEPRVELLWLKRQILGSRKIHDYEVAIEYESMIGRRMHSCDGYSGNQDGWKGFIDKEYCPGLETRDYAE